MLKKRVAPVTNPRYDIASRELQRLGALRGAAIAHLPEASILTVSDARGEHHFSLIANRAHSNVAELFDEAERRLPAEDSLLVASGFIPAYPNAFFVVDAAELPRFVDRVASLGSEADYAALAIAYGVRRTDPRFWAHSDDLHLAWRRWAPKKPASSTTTASRTGERGYAQGQARRRTSPAAASRRTARAKRRRVVLRVARRGVGQRVEREGKGPPRRAERPAPETARVRRAAPPRARARRSTRFSRKLSPEERDAVRVDERGRHQQDEPGRPQRLGQRRPGDRAVEEQRHQDRRHGGRDAEGEVRRRGEAERDRRVPAARCRRPRMISQPAFSLRELDAARKQARQRPDLERDEQREAQPPQRARQLRQVRPDAARDQRHADRQARRRSRAASGLMKSSRTASGCLTSLTSIGRTRRSSAISAERAPRAR